MINRSRHGAPPEMRSALHPIEQHRRRSFNGLCVSEMQPYAFNRILAAASPKQGRHAPKFRRHKNPACKEVRNKGRPRIP